MKREGSNWKKKRDQIGRPVLPACLLRTLPALMPLYISRHRVMFDFKYSALFFLISFTSVLQCLQLLIILVIYQRLIGTRGRTRPVVRTFPHLNLVLANAVRSKHFILRFSIRVRIPGAVLNLIMFCFDFFFFFLRCSA
jgi:hypothetical protein